MFGETGQLARATVGVASNSGLNLISIPRESCDLGNVEQIHSLIENAPADAIVLNAAAYTAVDKAESEPVLARAINTDAPRAMAEACAHRGLPLIHISTDYVFDGCNDVPYRESDPTNPQGVYGQTKLDGELAVLAAHPLSIILRTSWVYSPFGSNFVKTMLRVGAARDEVAVVNDQCGTPTSAWDIAQGITRVVGAIEAGTAESGVYHLAGDGDASWADFADAVFELQRPVWNRRPEVRRILSAEYPTLAKRPANSKLCSDRFERVFGYRAPHWTVSLQRVVRELGDA
jgi:dTDP-4-dehydrorhamnose reductase